VPIATTLEGGVLKYTGDQQLLGANMLDSHPPTHIWKYDNNAQNIGKVTPVDFDNNQIIDWFNGGGIAETASVAVCSSGLNGGFRHSWNNFVSNYFAGRLQW
jgi:hypothetical protein